MHRPPSLIDRSGREGRGKLQLPCFATHLLLLVQESENYVEKYHFQAGVSNLYLMDSWGTSGPLFNFQLKDFASGRLLDMKG